MRVETIDSTVLESFELIWNFNPEESSMYGKSLKSPIISLMSTKWITRVQRGSYIRTSLNFEWSKIGFQMVFDTMTAICPDFK